MKEKKKMSLAMQIFIALVLAIIAGLLMQNYTDFAESYIKPFGTNQVYCRSDRPVFHHVWYYFNE